MKYHEGELVLCTVDKVDNTMCFVHLPDGTKGTIISSEIAPGRIKFMRAYVVPNKKIVCKVLRVTGENINLSLRRVNPKEKKNVLQEYKQQLANKAAFKQILGKDYEKVKEKILIKYDNLFAFIEAARDHEGLLATYIPKSSLDQIQKITEKKKRQVEIKFTLNVKSFADDGVNKIKELFSFDTPNVTVTYISAGKFMLKYTAPDFKEGKQTLQQLFETMEQKAKTINTELEYKEEKS